jgi:GNAT superfamily N-acetyltransferase
MSIDYRLLRANDVDTAADLWVDNHPGLDSEQHQAWRREFRSIPDHETRTRVAVADNGTLLSIAHYWRQDMYDANGVLQPIGRVSHVFTRPDARRRGHAARLLELTIAAMGADGCQWSILTTSDEGRPLYERYGWRPLPIRQVVCTFRDPQPPPSGPYVVQPYDPASAPAGWVPLAPIYAAYNAERPLTIVRDAAYWQNYALRVDRWLSAGFGAVFVARRAHSLDRDSPPCAYIIAGFSADHGVRIVELGTLPGDEEALSPLLVAVAERAADHSMAGRPSAVPREPHLNAILATLCSGIDDYIDPDWMVRAVGPSVDERALVALPDAPGAVAWLFDDI